LYVIDGEYDVVRVTVELGESFEAGEKPGEARRQPDHARGGLAAGGDTK
jgi:hypothetical protein